MKTAEKYVKDNFNFDKDGIGEISDIFLIERLKDFVSQDKWVSVSLGLSKTIKERLEHFEKHGRTIEDDKRLNHSRKLIDGTLALISNKGEGNSSLFPNDWDNSLCNKMIEKTYSERLILAASLLIAEYDRINPPKAK